MSIAGVPYARAWLWLATSLAVLLFAAPASAAPLNDAFANATILAAEPPVSEPSNNVEASKEAEEPDHAGDPGGHSLWYSWTPSTTGPVDIWTCASFLSDVDTVLAVYTGSSLGALTPVVANDDGASPPMFPECRGTDSEVRFTATAGTTYRIAVDGASGGTGMFSLRVRGRPANDDFANAEILGASLPTMAAFGLTTRLATKEPGEPSHAGDPGGHSVWYSWTPSASGPVAISACGSEGEPDTLLAVYTGADLDALTPVAANDDAASQSCLAHGSEVQFTATAGTTYRIAVDGKGDSGGRITLNLEGGPANDAFANANVLSSGLPSSGSSSTKLASKEAGEPNHAGNAGGHSVWFSWTPSSSGLVEISTCPYTETGPDTLLAVYTGSAVDALAPVAVNDDDPSGCKEGASVTEFAAVAGTTYRIAVDSKGAGHGFFGVEIQPALPENDNFADAEALSPTPLFAGASIKHASKEAGEPNHAGNAGGHSVWFSWTPSSSGPASIIACDSSGALDTLLAVYTGSAVNSLTSVAANDNGPVDPPNELCNSISSMVEFTATAGTAYKIAVDGKAGATGKFFLAFERGPANDDFADAHELFAGLPSFASGTAKHASKEAGEPDHAGNTGGHSLWYSWTAPSDGPVAISTCTQSGALDTLLAVYTGSPVDALVQVAADDDTPVDDCRSSDSEVEFTAAAGTTYEIAVDAKGAPSGSFHLRLEGLAANDDFGKPQALGGAIPALGFSSTRFAGLQPDEPEHAGSPGGRSIWFKWTAPRSGPVSVDTCGSGIDTLLAVYTGSALAALTPVQSNDDSSGKCAPRSKLVFDALANTVYRIAVDGKAGAQGSVYLRIESRPENDDFGSAEPVRSKIPVFMFGSTLLATKQTGEPNHAGNPGGHSVWFSWTPSASRNVSVTACTETFDPLLAVYTGAALNALTPVATTDAVSEECDEGRSLQFAATAGTPYRFAVDGSGGEDGHFELLLEPVAATSKPPVVDEGSSVAGGGGGSSPAPVPTLSPPAAKPPIKKCKRGFKKVRVKGKWKCVKRKKPHHRRGKGKRRGHRG